MQAQINAEQAKHDEAKVNADALGDAFSGVFDPTAINSQIIQPAGAPQATGRQPASSTIEAGVLIGLVAGGLLGLGLAVWIDLRARKRAMTGAPPAAATPALRGTPPSNRHPVPRALPAATWLLSFAIAAEIFSGNWGILGVPAALDRVLLVLGLGGARPRGLHAVSDRHPAPPAAAHGAAGRRHLRHRVVDRRPHVRRVGGTVRAAGPLRPHPVPHVLPGAAGVRSDRQRRFLLGVLIVVGAYIGIVNFFEGVGLNNLECSPDYIVDP